MAVTPKQGTDLMNNFIKACPNAPKFNRAVEKWAARELIESYGVDKCNQAVLWYAKVSPRHEWRHFVRIIDSCITESEITYKDITTRRSHRAIANEWRSK